jgi:sigma-B regulation protein RsbU (phosphoserine phosphatase)
MHALIADDDLVTAAVLRAALRRLDLQAVTAHDGATAWNLLGSKPAPRIAIIDWMMPQLDGPELCRRIRSTPQFSHVYVILLTARDSRADVIAGLEAGADDYLIKPFDTEELNARIRTGLRIVSLQQQLTSKIASLEGALRNVKELKGLLPICCYCKRIRTDEDYWQQLEGYISDHSDAQFSHGICPGCFEDVQSELDAVG